MSCVKEGRDSWASFSRYFPYFPIFDWKIKVYIYPLLDPKPLCFVYKKSFLFRTPKYLRFSEVSWSCCPTIDLNSQQLKSRELITRSTICSTTVSYTMCVYTKYTSYNRNVLVIIVVPVIMVISANQHEVQNTWYEEHKIPNLQTFHKCTYCIAGTRNSDCLLSPSLP